MAQHESPKGIAGDNVFSLINDNRRKRVDVSAEWNRLCDQRQFQCSNVSKNIQPPIEQGLKLLPFTRPLATWHA